MTCSSSARRRTRKGHGQVSETGSAQISGGVDYDPVSQQILLHNPAIDDLKFDRSTPASGEFNQQIRAAWQNQINNPMRSDLPPHPYLALVKNNIQSIAYNGESIDVAISYE